MSLEFAVIEQLIKGSSAKAQHTDEGLVATLNSRWRAFGIFGALLFITGLTGLGFYWTDLWTHATLLKRAMYVVAIPWMSFLVFYFAIIPRNWRLVIGTDGVRERVWTRHYTFTPWSEITVQYDAARKNVVFRKAKGGKIEVSELANGFEEIRELALTLPARSNQT